MSQQYHIQSETTKYYLATAFQKEGELVFTSDGEGSIPEHSILTITPALKDAAVTNGTVTGPAGLYVALPKKPVPGDKLFWSKEKYNWEIRLTVTGDGQHTYQFTPAEGEDLYWFDKFGIGQIIEAKDGKDVVPPESFFHVTVAA